MNGHFRGEGFTYADCSISFVSDIMSILSCSRRDIGLPSM